MVSNMQFGKNGISNKAVGRKVFGTSFFNSLASSASIASGSLRTVNGVVAVLVCLLAFNERIAIVNGDKTHGLNYGKKQRVLIITNQRKCCSEKKIYKKYGK